MKKQKTLRLLVVAVSVLFAQQTFAQRGGLQTALSGGMQTSVPTGNFAEQYDAMPVGLAATFSAPTFRNSPIHFGLGFAWNRMNTAAQDVFLHSEQGFSSGSAELITNRYNYTAFMRFAPFRGRMQPFAEGIAGWSNYVSRNDINTRYTNGDLKEISDRVHNNMAWSYGWGAGIQIRVAPHIFLEGKVQRMYETETEMVDPSAIEISPNGVLDFGLLETRPEFITIQAGLTIKF